MIEQQWSGRKTLGSMILIVLLTFVVYSPTLSYDFVWDDFLVVVNNPFTHSWENFPKIFTREYITDPVETEYVGNYPIGSGENSYRPVATMSVFIDHAVWKLNPFGHHLSNLIFHLANVVLVFVFLSFVTRNRVAALISALFFGVHPLNTEAVTVVSFREDLLAFLFVMSSMILFVKLESSTKSARIPLYGASLIFYALALFSKEMAITLPVVLVVYDCYFCCEGNLGKVSSRIWSRYLGFWVISLFYLWVRFEVFKPAESLDIGYHGGSFYLNVLTTLKVFGQYLTWMLVPIGFHPTIPDTGYYPGTLFSLEALVPIVLILFLLTLAVNFYRTQKMTSFGILWIFITLLPVSNIIPIQNFIAVRYLYFPVMGFCLILGMLMTKLGAVRWDGLNRKALEWLPAISTVCLVIFYSATTVVKNEVWKNELTFRLELVTHYADSSRAYKAFGNAFLKVGWPDEAVRQYQQAIRLEPGQATIYNDLGNILLGQNNISEARQNYRKARELDPALAQAHGNYCTTLARESRLEESVDCYREAIRIFPNQVDAYFNLGVTYARLERWQEAIDVWTRVLDLRPGYTAAELNIQKVQGLLAGKPEATP